MQTISTLLFPIGKFTNTNKFHSISLEKWSKKITISWKQLHLPKFAEQPIVEEELLKSCLEETNQWYAIAKISGIKLCEALRKQYGFDAISLMPTNLYGPGDNYHPYNSHVFPTLIRKFNEAVENKIPKVTCWGTGSAI